MKRKYLAIFYQTILFILLFVQTGLLYLCLSTKGIPIPNSLIQKYIPEDLNFGTDQILFFLPYHFKFTDPEFKTQANNLIQISSPEIFVSWEPNYKNLIFNQWKVHGYTAKIDSQFYPQPMESRWLNLIFSKNQIQTANLHLQSNDKIVQFNYSAKEYRAQKDNFNKQKESSKVSDLTIQSIEQNHFIQHLFNSFYESENTSIYCYVRKIDNQSHIISTDIFSESINLLSSELKNLEAHNTYDSNSLETVLFFHADDFHHTQYPLKANSIFGKIKTDDTMQIDSIELEARSIEFKDTYIDAATGKATLRDADNFTINSHLLYQNHFLNLRTDYQKNAPANRFFIKAHLDANKLKTNNSSELALPNIQSTNPFFLQAEVIANNNLSPLYALGYLQGDSLLVNDESFEYLRSNFKLHDKKLQASSFFKINDRQLFTQTDFNLTSNDYKCTLSGTIQSTDLNSLLPQWWQNTFKDFAYNKNTTNLHDFAIYGNIDNPIPDLFLGSVQTKNLNYKDVPIKYGNLLVKGKNNCTEITLKDVQTERGQAEGLITITIKPDGFKRPESVRTKLKSKLTFKTAEKIFGNNIQKVLSNFDSTHAHEIQLESVFFDPHYTKHKNKSYYNLSIASEHPILFFKRPFNQLHAEIYGRNNRHFIRSAHSIFAQGQLHFEADIFDLFSNDPQIRINASLTDSNYSQAVADTFQNNLANIKTNTTSPLSLDISFQSKGSLIDLKEHNGFGNLTIKGTDLAKIHLLGPLSKALDELNLSIGVFSLNHLESEFLIQKEWIKVENLEINGKQSYVFGQGKIAIPDQSINFNMKVDLLKNRNLSFSKLGSIGKLLNPLTNIFNFKVTGTLQDQKWRSIFDPRNLF